MASEAERVSKKLSWVRKFFYVEEKNITDNSGGLQVQIYDVCNVRQLASQLSNFNAEEDLLGCTGHVI